MTKINQFAAFIIAESFTVMLDLVYMPIKIIIGLIAMTILALATWTDLTVMYKLDCWIMRFFVQVDRWHDVSVPRRLYIMAGCEEHIEELNKAGSIMNEHDDWYREQIENLRVKG